MADLRRPASDELPQLTQLCLRSKAYWGYDDAFMRACASELRLSESDLADDEIVVAVDGANPVGVAQVSRGPDGCFLEKLFVEPDHFGQGIGKLLFGWAVRTAACLGADELVVESDPDAVRFYRAMGCRKAGYVESGSIPGRRLPRLLRKVI